MVSLLGCGSNLFGGCGGAITPFLLLNETRASLDESRRRLRLLLEDDHHEKGGEEAAADRQDDGHGERCVGDGERVGTGARGHVRQRRRRGRRQRRRRGRWRLPGLRMFILQTCNWGARATGRCRARKERRNLRACGLTGTELRIQRRAAGLKTRVNRRLNLLRRATCDVESSGVARAPAHVHRAVHRR